MLRCSCSLSAFGQAQKLPVLSTQQLQVVTPEDRTCAIKNHTACLPSGPTSASTFRPSIRFLPFFLAYLHCGTHVPQELTLISLLTYKFKRRSHCLPWIKYCTPSI